MQYDGMREKENKRERVKRACTATDKARMYHEKRQGIKHKILSENNFNASILTKLSCSMRSFCYVVELERKERKES